MERKNTLGLEIPERTTSPEESFLARPKEVKAWITTLPIANVGETSRQVFKELVEFNRMELSPLTRIKIAELFRNPIDYISASLRRYYFDAGFPLSPKNRKVAVLNRELYVELATAYKIFIEDCLSAENSKPDRKMLVVSIHRAISTLATVLYQTVIVYDIYPPGLWREIHALYAYAESNRYHELPVKDSSNSNSTIDEVYRQLLLLAACSPYRLRQREIAYIKQQLPQWALQVTLSQATNRSESNSLFFVRLHSDSPPLQLSIMHSPPDKECRQLNAQGLVQLLLKEFEETPNPTNKSGPRVTSERLSRQQLRNLIHTLSAAPGRKFVRTRLNFELKTAIGLNAIHALLGAKPNSAEETRDDNGENVVDWYHPEQKSRPEGLRTDPVPEAPNYTISPLDLPPEEQILLSSSGENGDYAGSDPAWISPERSLPDPFPCKTSNESAGGYCILWNGPKAPKIKVGEIIGIQSASIENQFGIGVCRWIKNTPGTRFEVGLELISPSSAALFASHFTTSSSGIENRQKCLLLPEVKVANQVATLITNNPQFQVGDRIRIDQEQNRRSIRLTRLQESTGAFSQFEFVYSDEAPATQDQNREEDETDFTTIWSAI